MFIKNLIFVPSLPVILSSNWVNGGCGLLILVISYDFTEDLNVYLNWNNVQDKNYEMAKDYKTLGKTTTLGLTYNF